MNEFDNRSKVKLKSCDEQLNLLALEAIKDGPYNFIITCGYRSEQEQQRLFTQGRIKPGKIVTQIDGIKQKSKHNFWPSKAFDIAVIVDGKITWDIDFYIVVALHIKDIAQKMGINIEYGGDWENFKDYPHFQLKELFKS